MLVPTWGISKQGNLLLVLTSPPVTNCFRGLRISLSEFLALPEFLVYPLINFYLNIHIYLLYFWLYWVFVAVPGLSLGGEWGPLLAVGTGFSLWWPLTLQSMGSRTQA